MGIQDSKNISDGTAKGQAVDLTDQSSSGASTPSMEPIPVTEPTAEAPPLAIDQSGSGDQTGIQDSKNISDGAAKGQAVDLTDQPGPVGSTPPTDTIYVTEEADGVSPSGIDQGDFGGTAGIQDSKNISDGAAKGQAVDLTDQPGSGSGGPPTETDVVTKPTDEATPLEIGQAGSGGQTGIQNSKNISDGAAKGQASE